MSTTPHRPSQRTILLDAALALLREGGTLSLDSTAAAAGVTKPGLMYHFPTKAALVTALVDHQLDGYERDLTALLPPGTAKPTAHQRISAYVRWSLTTDHDAADLVMLSDPRLRESMTEQWATRLGPWVEIPRRLPARERARLNAARLIGDGCWYADATGCLPVAAADRRALLATALELLDGPAT